MSIMVSIIPIVIIGGIEGFQSKSLLLMGIIFLVTFCISVSISYFINRPLQKLTKNIDNISKGKLDVSLNTSEIYEINNLTESLNRVLASLKLAIHKVGVKKGEIFEDAVKAKEEFDKKNQDFLNSIHGWAWETDSKGIFTFCSKNVTKFIGYKPNEIIGQSIYDLMPPNYSKKVRSSFNDAAKKQTAIKNVEVCNISDGGKNFYFIANGYPIYDENDSLKGFRGVYTDITNEKNKDSKIKNLNINISNLKAEITGLIDELENKKPLSTNKNTTFKKKIDEKWSEHDFDSVFIFDENANILDCNENMYKRLGYTKSEILNLNMSDIDALESKNDLKDKIQIAKKNGVYSFKTIHKRKDGSAILVRENLQYLKDKNEYKCIVREDYSVKKSK
jgi:PAS domain S-box-containing protein